MSRHKYTTCISFGTDGEADYVELDATVSFSVAWGSPANPWGDDPGSGPVVEDIRLEAVDGKPFTGTAIVAAMIVDEVERVAETAMIESASHDVADDEDRRDEARRDAMLEDRL